MQVLFLLILLPLSLSQIPSSAVLRFDCAEALYMRDSKILEAPCRFRLSDRYNRD